MGKRTVIATLRCCQLARPCRAAWFVVVGSFDSFNEARDRQSLARAQWSL